MTFFFQSLGLLICPKVTEAKIMIKHSFTTPNAKKLFVGKKWFCTWDETI